MGYGETEQPPDPGRVAVAVQEGGWRLAARPAWFRPSCRCPPLTVSTFPLETMARPSGPDSAAPESTTGRSAACARNWPPWKSTIRRRPGRPAQVPPVESRSPLGRATDGRPGRVLGVDKRRPAPPPPVPGSAPGQGAGRSRPGGPDVTSIDMHADHVTADGVTVITTDRRRRSSSGSAASCGCTRTSPHRGSRIPTRPCPRIEVARQSGVPPRRSRVRGARGLP